MCEVEEDPLVSRSTSGSVDDRLWGFGAGRVERETGQRRESAGRSSSTTFCPPRRPGVPSRSL